MRVVEDWDALEQWKLIPDIGEDGLPVGFDLYFEDGEADWFCAAFDCCGYVRITMVNTEEYGYVLLSPEIMSSLARVSRKVRKFFEKQEGW